ERSARLFPFRGYSYIFNQMSGAQSQMPAFLINIHRVSDIEDALAYIERIKGMGSLLDALSAQSAERAARGIQPPQWVYGYVIADIRNLTTSDPARRAPNAVLADFAAKVAKLVIDADAAAQLVSDVQADWQLHVYPAYRRRLAELERQQAGSPSDDGVWRLPVGPAYYQALPASYTTTDMSAQQIHDLGLSEVPRIHKAMQAIMAKV